MTRPNLKEKLSHTDPSAQVLLVGKQSCVDVTDHWKKMLEIMHI